MRPTERDLMVARAVVGRNVANETDLAALIESLPEPDPPISFKVRRVPCACRNGCYKCGWRGSTLVHDTQPAEHEQAAQDADEWRAALGAMAQAMLDQQRDYDAAIATARADGARAERARIQAVRGAAEGLYGAVIYHENNSTRAWHRDVLAACQTLRAALDAEHGGKGEWCAG